MYDKSIQKRAQFDSKKAIQDSKDNIKQLHNNKIRLIREKDQISNDLLSNSNNTLKSHWEKELEKVLNRIGDIEDVISNKEAELQSLKNSSQLIDEQYFEIIEEFNSIFSKSDSEEQKDLVKTLIRNVESTVVKNTGNCSSGEIKIDYVCDHYLIPEWDDIKNANSEKRFKVRTSYAPGSPGWI